MKRRPLTPEAPLTRSFYTVSLLRSNGTSEVSRFFNTLAAARKWAGFLLTLGEIAAVSIYRGQAGGELVERRAA